MTRKRTTGQVMMMASLSVAAGATTFSAGQAAGPSTSLSKPIQTKQAAVPVSPAQIQKLENAVKLAPQNADAHFKLAQAYCQQKKFVEARKELCRAVRLGRGSLVAKQANQYLMTHIPAQYLKPKVGEGTEMLASIAGIGGMSRGIGEAARPKVFEFYADWCEPCKKLKPVMDKVKAQYGDQVEVVSYNVDDVKNQQILDLYEVSPIPTVIFLTPDNKVVGYSIGYSGEQNVHKELKKILADGSPAS